MGSWDATCGISQLPIKVGDPIVVNFISKCPWEKEHNDGSDYCYSTGRWYLAGFPIHATYDDYGRFSKVIDDKYFQYSMNCIQSSLIEFEVGENKYHDIAVKRDKFNLKLLQEAIHENRLHIMTGMGPPSAKSVPIGRFMIHKEIYDAAMEKCLRPMHTKITNRIAEIEKSDRISQYAMLECFRIDWMGYSPIRRYLDDIFYKNKKFEDDDILMVSKIFALSMYMDELRKSYQPQQGAGSQSCDYRYYRQLNAVMEKIMQAQIDKYELDLDDE